MVNAGAAEELVECSYRARPLGCGQSAPKQASIGDAAFGGMIRQGAVQKAVQIVE
jgi:hypothetical protein